MFFFSISHWSSHNTPKRQNVNMVHIFLEIFQCRFVSLIHIRQNKETMKCQFEVTFWKETAQNENFTEVVEWHTKDHTFKVREGSKQLQTVKICSLIFVWSRSWSWFIDCYTLVPSQNYTTIPYPQVKYNTSQFVSYQQIP